MAKVAKVIKVKRIQISGTLGRKKKNLKINSQPNQAVPKIEPKALPAGDKVEIKPQSDKKIKVNNCGNADEGIKCGPDWNN